MPSFIRGTCGVEKLPLRQPILARMHGSNGCFELFLRTVWKVMNDPIGHIEASLGAAGFVRAAPANPRVGNAGRLSCRGPRSSRPEQYALRIFWMPQRSHWVGYNKARAAPRFTREGRLSADWPGPCWRPFRSGQPAYKNPNIRRVKHSIMPRAVSTRNFDDLNALRRNHSPEDKKCLAS